MQPATLAIAILLQAAPAAAQEGVGQQLPNESVLAYRGPVIVRHPLVIKELDISRRKLERLRPHIERCYEILEGPPPTPRHEREFAPPDQVGGYKFEAQEELRERLRRSLTGPQFRRLEQLVLQAEGVDAFRMPGVLKALEVTEEQARKIDGLLSESVARMFRRPPPPPGQDVEVGREEYDRLRKASDEQAYDEILAVLGDPQKRKWVEMTGPILTSLFGRANASLLDAIRKSEERYRP
jgi:hypothetical protein